MNRRIVAIVPARNEARTISSIVRSLTKLDLVVIVVDDGSTDDTATEAERAGAVVIRHERNQGYTAAVLSGVMRADGLGVENVVTIDGDGAHDPSDVPTLLHAHIEGACSVTVGNRLFSPGLAANSTKRLVNHLAWPMLQRATGMQLPVGDYASGLRVYSLQYAKRLVTEVVRLRPFGLCFYSIVHAVRSGLRVAFCPCSVRYDASRLLYTKCGEFNDFLSTLMDLSDDKKFIAICATIIGAMHRRVRLRFVVREMTIYGVPVSGEDGYIFQEQASFYEGFVVDDGVVTLSL